MRLIIGGLALMGLVAGCQQTSAAGTSAAPSKMETTGQWAVKADYVDACNCKPACPCLYGSPPTERECRGATLVDIKQGHFDTIPLDGVRVVAVYSGGKWIKFYVGDNASPAQADAVVKLLPSLEDFFGVSNVIEVKRVPVSITREGDGIRFSVPNTTVDLELMRGTGGVPLKTEGLPHADFGNAPPYLDHTQYRTVQLKHQGGEQHFDYSGTNGFAARIDDAGRI